MLVTVDDIIRNFYDSKRTLDSYKKIVDEYNTDIKEYMQEANLQEYETPDGLVAKITTQHRESFNEDKLISKLKKLGVTTPIKTVEVIDYDELENTIYNNLLDAFNITDCKETKEVVTLKVTQKKGE